MKEQSHCWFWPKNMGHFSFNYSICPKWAQSWIQPNSALHLFYSSCQMSNMELIFCHPSLGQPESLNIAALKISVRSPIGILWPTERRAWHGKDVTLSAVVPVSFGRLVSSKFVKAPRWGLRSKIENKEVSATCSNQHVSTLYVYIYVHVSFACILILYICHI